MHRLISSKYSRSGTVLEDVTNSEDDLATATALDAATNERVLGETRGLAGISPFELVYGFPNAHIIRAAFLHPNKAGGSRFNDTTRGAWYAAEQVETCIAEVAWHRARRLSDIIEPDEPGQMPSSDSATYDDWQADFSADFHILEPASNYPECLQAEPVPECYQAPQALARYLLSQRSNGIVYPSVRREGQRCLACFRPALVYSPHRDKRYELHLSRKDGTFETRVSVRQPEDDDLGAPSPVRRPPRPRR
ncbi:MAG TPA: RES family NAD+ phosphorylase [Terracidiphilus sp.]|jgi:RES domain-containing protein